MDIRKIDDKARFERVYHAIGRCAETFYLFAPNIPRALNQVVQNIYGRYDDAMYHVFKASNTYEMYVKVSELEKAHECLFFQQSSLEMLVKSHGCTIGQANSVIDETRKAYEQTSRWLNATLKGKSVSEGAKQGDQGCH